MDEQLGRLIEAFERKAAGSAAVIIAGDHGEGLGEHGESEHGFLAYQSTMHVPMVIAGPGVAQATLDTSVSTRRVFHTILDFAGIASDKSLRGEAADVVLGEALVPFLQFGWQPQIMGVDGRQKAILAGKLEVYDVTSGPAETRNLAPSAEISRELRAALR